MTPATLPQALARAAETARGVSFWDKTGTSLRLGFADLRERAERLAGGLVAAGLEPGARALVLLPTSPELLATLFGCVRVGVIPAAAPPPQGEAGVAAYAKRLRAMAAEIGAETAIGQADVLAGLELGLRALDPTQLEASSPTAAELPSDPQATAILQFTSGSTATPKAVTLSHGALLANCAQIAAGARIDAGDVMVSWLPLFHDMGFLAAVTAPAALGLDLVLSTPRVFLRDPLSWLRAFSEHRGTHCGAPSFAYRYLLGRTGRGALPELDLSSWKVACVGAEPIHGPTLRAFAARLAPLGFAASTLTPCYGLAEATLALSMKPFDAVPQSLHVDRGALAQGEVRLAEEGGVELPSSGPALPEVELTIHAPADGSPLPEGRVGEVWARSPSLFSGYWGRGREGFSDGGLLRTGDLGFLHEGELYVTGRIKDTIILRGENYAPAEIEWAAEVQGVRSGRVVAFGRANPKTATEDLVLLAEVERGADAEAVTLAVRHAVFERTGLAVNDLELVPRGTLPVTTSGKLQRGLARKLFEQQRAADSAD